MNYIDTIGSIAIFIGLLAYIHWMKAWNYAKYLIIAGIIFVGYTFIGFWVFLVAFLWWVFSKQEVDILKPFRV